MKFLDLARRLLSASALLLLGGIAISVMTRDAWLVVGHVAGMASAVMAAIAVMVLIIAGLRRTGAARPPKRPPEGGVDSHEQGLTGLD
jgi:hypothetical protein